MPIDWFTVGAQALNFLILVWLMKRFLYKPVLNAIDAREKRIADELAAADAKRVAAQKESDEFQHKNEVFDQERAALMNQASDEAKVERKRIIDAARKAADDQQTRRAEAMRLEANSLNNAITRRTKDEVFSITRQTLADLASSNLEQQMSEVFIRRLQALDETEKDKLGEALKAGADPALVRSAFDLSEQQRTAIQKALNDIFTNDFQLRFETAPDIISGIELSTNGQKVAWSVADYLSSLEKGITELLTPKVISQLTPKPDTNAPLTPTVESLSTPKSDTESEAKVDPASKLVPLVADKSQPELKKIAPAKS